MVQISWTSPRTWAVAETLTAANMNTHVRDNLNWLANDKPRCSAVRNAQSIPNASSTTVSFTDADEYDTGPMHDPGSNSSRVIVPSGGGGLYEVKGMLVWNNGTAASTRSMGFAKNGTLITGVGDERDSAASGDSVMSTSFNIQLVATDYIEMTAFQSTGGALNVFGRLQLRWVAF